MDAPKTCQNLAALFKKNNNNNIELNGFVDVFAYKNSNLLSESLYTSNQNGYMMGS
jgi:hypothetical protein